VILASRRHPLAESDALSLEEVLGETFISFRAAVDPTWAGFWSLDDHRGEPPGRVTSDTVCNPQEVLAALMVRTAITAVPASVATVVSNRLSEITAIALLGAAPAEITIVGHADGRNPLVSALMDFTGIDRAAGRPEPEDVEAVSD
jgi:hypothetical protein